MLFYFLGTFIMMHKSLWKFTRITIPSNCIMQDRPISYFIINLTFQYVFCLCDFGLKFLHLLCFICLKMFFCLQFAWYKRVLVCIAWRQFFHPLNRHWSHSFLTFRAWNELQAPNWINFVCIPETFNSRYIKQIQKHILVSCHTSMS